MDRFRNEFELTSDSITKGSTHTSKVEPKASLRETGNTVGTQTISVQIQNTDHAAMENCYFYVVNQQGEDVPAFDETGDGSIRATAGQFPRMEKRMSLRSQTFRPEARSIWLPVRIMI